MSHPIDYSAQRPKSVLATLLTNYAGHHYTDSDFLIQSIQVDPQDPRNITAIIVLNNGPIEGVRELTWQRLDVAEYTLSKPTTLSTAWRKIWLKNLATPGGGVYNTTSELNAIIASFTNTPVIAEDILDIAIDTSDWVYPHTFEVSFKPDHLVWYGTLEVTVAEPLVP